MSYTEGKRYRTRYVELQPDMQAEFQLFLNTANLEEIRGMYEMIQEEAYYRKMKGEEGTFSHLNLFAVIMSRNEKVLREEYELFSCMC